MKLCLKLLIVLWILTVIQVSLFRFVDPTFTALMGWRWLQNKVTTKYHKMPNYHWRQLKEISPHLIKAVLAGEDQRFLTHNGFDFIEMKQAVQDILMDDRVRGASTITMQVARTVFLWPDRNWFRKIVEAYYTILIEILWNKKRILEIYLNTVDWGTGIMGAEAASRKYFNTTSSHITLSQAALLAAILPRPHKWSPLKPSRNVRERQKRIMKDMYKMPML